MMKRFSLLLVLFVGCTPSKNQLETNQGNQKSQEKIQTSLEDKIRNKIEASLSIQGNEKYTIETYSAHCNADTIEDKIITINLLDRAKEKAISLNKTNVAAQTGYMGNYNYILFVNGVDSTLSEPKPIPSSAMASLKISFENIQSDLYKSIVVDAKVTDGGYRYFYFLVGIQPKQVLYVPIYEDLGKSTVKGFTTSYEKGSYSLAKDIVVYDGTITPVTFEHSDEMYEFYPVISPTKTINRRWFLNNQQLKYFTMTK